MRSAIATNVITLMINPEVSDKPMQLRIGKAKRPKPWLLGLVAAGLLGATTVYFIVQGNTPKADITDQSVVVQSKDLTVQIKANGVVQAVRKINLSPKREGRIDHLYVDEGAFVKQSQLIARMDNEQFQQQVNQYKAILAKAQADLAQKRNGNRPEEIAKAKAEVTKNVAQVIEARSRLALFDARVKRKQFPTQQGAISYDSLDESLTEQRNARENLQSAEASLAVARQELALQLKGYRVEEIAASEAEVAQAAAQLRSYQTQLEDTQIRAPFAGTITRKFASEGDFVTPTTSASSSDGATSASIAELSQGLEVEAKIPEASIARIKPGQQVEIRSDAYYDKSFKGRVRLVAPRAIQDSQENKVTSFRVKVLLQTGQDLLKSGMNVKLSFLGDKIPNALVVPLAAIVTQKDGQTGVWIQNEKQAKLRPVTVGSVSGDQIQILNGVAKGERILLSPPQDQIIPGIDNHAF